MVFVFPLCMFLLPLLLRTLEFWRLYSAIFTAYLIIFSLRTVRIFQSPVLIDIILFQCILQTSKAWIDNTVSNIRNLSFFIFLRWNSRMCLAYINWLEYFMSYKRHLNHTLRCIIWPLRRIVIPWLSEPSLTLMFMVPCLIVQII